MRRFMVMVLVAVLGAFGAAATAGAAQPHDARMSPPTLPGMEAMMAQQEHDLQELRGLAGEDFEIAYLQMMRGHHLAAVEMAEMVPAKAVHPELGRLARTIVADQEREIGQMEGWLRDWYGIARPAEMSMAGMDEMMAALMRRTGAEFEQAFLLMMVHHHQGAVDMSLLVRGRATHPALVQFARGVIDAQTQEIAQMRDWAMTWYGFDPMPMGHGGMPMPAMPNTGAGGGGAARQPTGAAPAAAGLAALGVLLVGGGRLRRKVFGQ